MGVKLEGHLELKSELRRLSTVRFDAVCEKSMMQIYQRGMAEGGTPVSDETTRPGGPHGELRMSLSKSGSGEKTKVGYTKSYAPHVEFGHRTVNGGYVEGQLFLKKNVESQVPILKNDIVEQIRRGGN
ncbi:MAG: hypothetical protein RR547_00525 [Raoultibacter sp.]